MLVSTTAGRKHLVLRRPRDGQSRQLWASFRRSLTKAWQHPDFCSQGCTSITPLSRKPDGGRTCCRRHPALSPFGGLPAPDRSGVDALLFGFYLSGFSRGLRTHNKKIRCHLPFPVNLNYRLKSSGETEKTNTTWAPAAEILICLVRAWLPR